MTTSVASLKSRTSWKALEAHHSMIRSKHLRTLVADDPTRGERLTAEAVGIYLDYSKNRINDETLKLLLQLAGEVGLRSKIDAMFKGEKINLTEKRAVLHVALRAPKGESIIVDGEDVVPPVHAVLDKMAAFSERVRSGEWLGHTGKRVRNVVNIGIGGSDLGPVMAYEALRHYSQRDLTFRFVSNIDGTDFVEATHDLDPEETLFIISSKTFTTLETMTNARSARDWSLATLKDPAAVAKHFVAVSTNGTEVTKFGIDTANMFGFWDWVGGRYSMDSAIGLATMLAVGPDNFRSMLAGFHEMDVHFRTAPFGQNLPVLMGLLAVWYNNFFGAQTVAVLPYEQYLKRFPAYLQQLTMESNGKRRRGPRVLRWITRPGPISLGRTGDERSALVLPVDPPGDQVHPVRLHRLQQGAQSAREAPRLPPGQRLRPVGGARVRQDLRGSRRRRGPCGTRATQNFRGEPPGQHHFPGRIGPRKPLGKLVALYEHSVFTQGAVWDIDSFDQWGVELGKVLAQRIIPELDAASTTPLAHDSSTNALIRRYRESK